MKELAIITGADGGMGRVITLALAKAGYKVVMACLTPAKARPIMEEIKSTSRNNDITLLPLDLTSFASVTSFVSALTAEMEEDIKVLVNNAGVLSNRFRQTENGLESTVSVNYAAPYLLTRLLLPKMKAGSRIVNTVSCTYAIGKIPNHFFEQGRDGAFFRIPVYSNTKLALLWFTLELAERIKEKGITVNAADPGIVNTNIITMHAWFDPLTDIFFRPFIRTPEQGAATAIHLALSEEVEGVTGRCFASCKEKKIPARLLGRPEQKQLWIATEEKVKQFLQQ